MSELIHISVTIAIIFAVVFTYSGKIASGKEFHQGEAIYRCIKIKELKMVPAIKRINK